MSFQLGYMDTATYIELGLNGWTTNDLFRLFVCEGVFAFEWYLNKKPIVHTTCRLRGRANWNKWMRYLILQINRFRGGAIVMDGDWFAIVWQLDVIYEGI